LCPEIPAQGGDDDGWFGYMVDVLFGSKNVG